MFLLRPSCPPVTESLRCPTVHPLLERERSRGDTRPFTRLDSNLDSPKIVRYSNSHESRTETAESKRKRRAGRRGLEDTTRKKGPRRDDEERVGERRRESAYGEVVVCIPAVLLSILTGDSTFIVPALIPTAVEALRGTRHGRPPNPDRSLWHAGIPPGPDQVYPTPPLVEGPEECLPGAKEQAASGRSAAAAAVWDEQARPASNGLLR